MTDQQYVTWDLITNSHTTNIMLHKISSPNLDRPTIRYMRSHLQTSTYQHYLTWDLITKPQQTNITLHVLSSPNMTYKHYFTWDQGMLLSSSGYFWTVQLYETFYSKCMVVQWITYFTLIRTKPWQTNITLHEISSPNLDITTLLLLISSPNLGRPTLPTSPTSGVPTTRPVLRMDSMWRESFKTVSSLSTTRLNLLKCVIWTLAVKLNT